MKANLSLRRLLLASASLAAVNSAHAATLYWDGTSASWNTNTNWSTDSAADTPDPTTVPGALDDAVFNISTVNGAETITLDANQAIYSMLFNNTGTTALTGGGTARTLSLGTGGITVASGAGAVTLGSGVAGDNVLLNLAGAQTWTNNTANAFTINNTASTFTRQTGATLLFNKANTGNFAISTTVAPLVNSIIGPWAFFGTGANQRYAVSGAAVTGLTGTTTTGLSTTNAAANYIVDGTAGTLGGGDYSSNTMRYSGNVDYSPNFYNSTVGGSTYTTNGILATGASGTLTLRRTSTTGNGRLIVGGTGELVIAGQQAVTINVPIVDGTPTASRLIYSGSNTLILGGENTYTGATTVSSGTLRLNSSLALQNSPLNTSGSIAGDATNGLKTALTALTLGGLTGDKDIASLFTTSAGGYSGVTALTLKPVTGATHNYSGVIANGAANMNLIKSGAGTQILAGVNTYTGSTTISAGTLILNNATALGTSPGVDGTGSISMAAGTTLRSNYIIADAGNVDSFVHAPITVTGTGSVNFHPGAGSSVAPAEAVTFNLNGVISGTEGTNVVFSTPTTSLSNADSIIVLGAASTYDGNTTITTGNANDRLNIKAGVANALPATTVLTFDNIAGGGSFRTTQFDLNGNDQTLAGLSNGGVVPSFRRQTVTNSNGTLATLTINNSADFTFGGATTDTNGTGTATTRAQITGNIALVKSGSGNLTLGGTLTGGATPAGNTYTGDTTVNEGILSLGWFNPSNESSTIIIATSGATLDLNFTGTDTVDKLFIGTTQMAAGEYKAVGSAASGTELAQLTGTGTLTVTSGPSGGGYTSWASFNGAGVNLGDDHDNDGVDNGTEYFLGGPNGDTTGFTLLPGVDEDNGTLSVTWDKGTGYSGTYGTDFWIETSEDLGVTPWTQQTLPMGNVTDDPDFVKITFPTPLGTRLFTRLVVKGP